MIWFWFHSMNQKQNLNPKNYDQQSYVSSIVFHWQSLRCFWESNIWNSQNLRITNLKSFLKSQFKNYKYENQYLWSQIMKSQFGNYKYWNLNLGSYQGMNGDWNFFRMKNIFRLQIFWLKKSISNMYDVKLWMTSMTFGCFSLICCW